MSTFLSNTGYQLEVLVTSSAHLVHSVVAILTSLVSSFVMSNSKHFLEFPEQFHIRVTTRSIKTGLDGFLRQPGVIRARARETRKGERILRLLYTAAQPHVLPPRHIVKTTETVQLSGWL